MQRKDIEIYSEERDNSIVRMPGRRYLGSVMQGDSLFLLHAEAMDILESLKYNPGNEMFYAAYSIAKNLEDRLTHYIRVCNENDLELGLRFESSVEDYADLIDSGL